jgi:hypothetical protein
MTDAVLLTYDPENAGKLPAKFVVPPTPTDAAVKPQAAASALLSSIDQQNRKFGEFQERLLTPVANSVLVEYVLPWYKEITTLLVQTLRLSLISVSLSNQLALTSGASGLAKMVDMLNRALKAKCLASQLRQRKS